jgi:hypothetical protein
MNDVMKPDGVNVIAVLVIASFAIDRTVAAVLFIVGFFGAGAQSLADADPALATAAARKRKLVYFLLAGALCAAVLIELPNFRVLNTLGFAANRTLDFFVTGLIVLGGSDRMADLLGKVPGAAAVEPPPPPPKPIEVSGRLILEEPGK